MAKGLCLSDGQVLIDYGKRRRVPIPSAQRKTNGYKPPCCKLPPEVLDKLRDEFSRLRRESAVLGDDVIEKSAFGRPLTKTPSFMWGGRIWQNGDFVALGWKALAGACYHRRRAPFGHYAG